LNVDRYLLAGCGTTSDALSMSGTTGAAANNTEKYSSGTIYT